MTLLDDILLREARDEDAAGVIALVGSVYAEYPGCILDVDHEETDLKTPASSYSSRDGDFWVAARDGRVIGCIACLPTAEQGIVVEKFYIEHSARGHGLGRRLYALVEEAAARCKASHIRLWSDTHFTTAHRFYKAAGYHRDGLRRLDDLSQNVEYGLRKML